MNKVKVISEKNDFVIKDGIILAYPNGATPTVAMDNRMYVIYDLGIKLVIPTGMIALVLPPNNASRFSVAQSGNFVLLPGVHEKVSIEYKINTDSIPRVFELNEQCAQIVFISTEQINFETVIVVAEVKDQAAPAMESDNLTIEEVTLIESNQQHTDQTIADVIEFDNTQEGN